MPVVVFWEHPGVTFQENRGLFCTCVHIHFCMMKLTLKSVFVTFAGFLLGCFRLSCSSHHNPAPFCYIINHVFKVSYELTYFVVVNKILTV